MGCQRLIVLTAILLFAKDHEVSAQYATILECLPQTATAISMPSIQAAGQYILPAIIQPIIPGYDSYVPEPPPSCPSYCNCPAPSPGYPPIIVKEGDDFLRTLLYFLLFSNGNKNDGFSIAPSCKGCPSGSGKCQCCCECPNCSKNKATYTETSTTVSAQPIYVPVPIAIPVYTGPDGSRYIDGFCDDILVQEPCGQYSCSARDNEINLIIRTE